MLEYIIALLGSSMIIIPLLFHLEQEEKILNLPEKIETKLSEYVCLCGEEFDFDILDGESEHYIKLYCCKCHRVIKIDINGCVKILSGENSYLLSDDSNHLKCKICKKVFCIDKTTEQLCRCPNCNSKYYILKNNGLPHIKLI